MTISRAGTKKAKAAKVSMAAIIAALVLFAMAGPAAGMGIGVAPPELTITDALRGNTYEENIIIFNLNDTESSYELTASESINSWVSFYLPDSPDTAITSVKVPAKSSLMLLVKIAIPADTPNGRYDGELTIIGIVQGAGEGQIGVGMQAPVQVHIEVTGTQIISGKVNDILTNDVEVGYPLRLIVLFQNTGNVEEAPLIEATIAYKGDDIANFSSNSTKVAAGKAGNIEVEWDTTGKAPAEYTAKVAVTLDGKILMEKDLTFNILPLGEMTRSGEIKDVIIEGSTIVGIPCKVKATFANTGQIDAMVYFKGDVYLGENLIQVITSDTLLVKRGEQEVLTADFTPEQPGDLTIKVQATFEGKKSEIKEINLTAKELHTITLTPKPTETTPTQTTPTATGEPTTTQSSLPIYTVVAVVVVAIGGIVGVGTIRRKRQNGNNNKKSGNGEK